MEAQEKLFERIERFLAGNMSKEESALFEAEREQHVLLEKEVRLHIEARKAIRAGGRERLNQQFEQAYEAWKVEEAKPLPQRLWQHPVFWTSAAAVAAILFVFLISNISWVNQEQDLFVQYYESPSSDAARDLVETGAQNALQEAILLYQAGEYEKAIFQFDGLQADSNFTYTSMTLYYQGASYMELEQYDLALNKFQAVSHPLYLEQGRWYSVLAYLKLEKEAEAKELLQIIIQQKKHVKQQEAQEILLSLGKK